MTIRVGINGFGRIGRNYFRALLEQGADIEIVAVNDLGDTATTAHLLKYDTILGRLKAEVSHTADTITVDGHTIKVLSERDPADIPWGELGVDIVIESTGIFTKKADAAKHIAGGAKKVLISAPAKDEDITIVMGVNQDKYDAAEPPRHLQRLLHHQLCGADGQGPRRELRHRQGPDDDGPRVHQRPAHPGLPALGPAPRPRRRREHHPDHHRCRQGHRAGPPAAQGQARRHRDARPGPDRLGHRPGRRAASARSPRTRSTPRSRRRPRATLKGFLDYTEDPIVSSDIVGDPASCTFDSSLTMVQEGNAVKILGWYDNEWGYSNRLVDLTVFVGSQL